MTNEKRYDAFLSLNSADLDAVKIITKWLKNEADLKVWFYPDEVPPGTDIQDAMQIALNESKACVVFIGPSGIGPWQDQEMKVALAKRVRDKSFRVVPIVLPRGQRPLQESDLPDFLRNLVWDAWRELNDAKALYRLHWGILGKQPEQQAEIEIHQNINPFRGLEFFREIDAPYFFGRNAVIDLLFERLKSGRFLAVLGPSGSGKSSVVQAGLIPKLKRELKKNSPNENAPVLVTIFTPKQEPLEELAFALRSFQNRPVEELIDRLQKREESLHLINREITTDKATDQIFLVVDQFEEVFTVCRHESRRQQFLDRLFTAVEIPNGPTSIILTMRSDFLGKCASYAHLNAYLNDKAYQIGPMRRDEIREAIVAPAALTGLTYEDGLVERILDDVEGAPGELPLFEHALLELYERRKRVQLTLQAYKEIGGIAGALTKRAEAEYDKLEEIQKEILRKIFVFHLIQTGEGMEDTRRRANKEDLLAIGGQPEIVEQLLARLSSKEARLLTTHADHPNLVEVAHEALIRKWPKVQEWLKDERATKHNLDQLRRAIDDWQKGMADHPRGQQLARFETLLLPDHVESLTSSEKEFLETCIAAREAEKQAEIERVQALTEAKQRAEILLARNYWENGQQAQADGNLLSALHFMTEAIRLAPSGKNSGSAVQQDLPEHLFAIHFRQGYEHEKSVKGAVFSKDEKRILTWSDDGSARLWEAASGAPLGPKLQHENRTKGAIFSADEKRVLTWSEDRSARLWETATGVQLGPKLQHDNRVGGAIFSADEKRILTWSADGSARLWETATGAQLGPNLQHESGVNGAIFFANEKHILTWSADGSARLWEAATGAQLEPVLQHEGSIWGAIFSKDERLILTWSDDGSARLWEAASGEPLGPNFQHENRVMGAIFSSDEKRILTWSYDGSARLWEAASGAQLGPNLKHEDYVRGAAFSKDEKRILTWSYDGSARLWEAASGAQLGPKLQHEDNVRGAAFSTDEKSILTWSGSSARLWEVASCTQLGPKLQHEGNVWGAIFSADEKRILTWSDDGSARLWEATDNAPPEPILQHENRVGGAIFSADEKRILTWSDDGSARLWETDTGTPLGSKLQHASGVNGATFFAEEKRILTWSADGSARLWEAASGTQLGITLQHEGPVFGAIFSKDEKLILTWSDDGSARLWEAATGTALRPKLQHDDWVWGAMFSTDEKRILTWSNDGSARLWETATGTQLGPKLQHENRVGGAIFSADEKRILTWSDDGSARLWEAATGAQLGPKLQHENRIGGAIFCANEKRILTWSDDRSVRLWEAATGTALGPKLQHDDWVKGAVFSADEKRILTWSADGSARLWESTTGTPLGPKLQHDDWIWGAIFSAGEKCILTWSADGSARLWDTATGALLGPKLQHENRIGGAVFSPDEKRILTWSDDGTVRLWNVPGDLDFPNDKYVLQVQALTGTKFDPLTRQISVIPIAEWRKIQQEWLAFAREHAKTCQYKRQNVYLRFWEK